MVNVVHMRCSLLRNLSLFERGEIHDVYLWNDKLLKLIVSYYNCVSCVGYKVQLCTCRMKEIHLIHFVENA